MHYSNDRFYPNNRKEVFMWGVAFLLVLALLLMMVFLIFMVEQIDEEE